MKTTQLQRALAANGRNTHARRLPGTLARHCLAGCILAATALTGALPSGAAEAAVQTSLEQWLLRRLNEPTERERTHERAGHVYVYDGLADRDVDRALDTQFDRIEYMMFVGTRRTAPVASDTAGQTATESPGCN
jgi:hypothetical protein